MKKSKDLIYNFSGLIMDIARHEVVVDGRMVELTAKEFNLLHFLIKNNGIVFSRAQLLGAVWGINVAIETRTVDVHIRRLRKKLGEVRYYILTLRGVGYKFRAKEKN
ncbi:MAG: winged helix-turn-helix domain-containing protein [Candidatus Margulisiibacteriota bacterium]